jgi:hypothetical protein
MSAGVIVPIVGGLALVTAMLWPKKAAAATPQAAPAADPATAKAGGVPAPPALPPASSGSLPAPLVKEAIKAIGAPAATVVAGITVNNALGDVTEKFAGKGAADTVRVFGPQAAVGFAAQKAVTTIGAAVGLPPSITKHLGQTAGLAVVGGPLAVGIKVNAEIASKAIRLVAGKKAETAVRGVVKQFDITNPKSVASKPVAAIAKGVKALGGLFGKKR